MSRDIVQQMRNEAIDMLVLWAASKEYSAEIETVLKHWAATFEITDTELNDRIMAAATGQLTRPCSASANAWTRMILQRILSDCFRRPSPPPPRTSSQLAPTVHRLVAGSKRSSMH